MHDVDLTPIFGYVNQFALLVLLGLVAWIVKEATSWLRAHCKFLTQQTDQALANGLNTALQNGVAIAMNKLGGVEAEHSSVEVKGLIQSMAVQYAVNHAPEAVAHFGLNPVQLANKALAYLPTPPSVVAAVTAPAIAKGDTFQTATGETGVIGKASPPGTTADDLMRSELQK